ncbi:cysteine--tRNA ligase [Coriobacteriia bacterium Es71-Z0120]|uniref:cysteine--tRNA ligase n=1 Tax=Parvivirga hydrogeniphila TaxID=2939460 RepID=UPI002260A3D7|nr:cysteine--tRNA ligase [Parvivirga hydrogeniphila]MCL4078512.1 cysteine--tRNA ligase [Parvivirga hydrogeniphila]
MAIRIYNTMSRTKEEFVPREPGKVAMYVCGPTVYNHIHVGNARTFLSFDVIRRYLAWRGYEVTFVQNITDVDDKIIKRAQEEGRSPAEIAETYTLAFRSAMDALGVLPPTRQPLATQTIPDMIAMVERLIERGHAYVVDGDVYFSVRSFPGYGELSGRDIDELEAGARVEVDERKQDPLDFALWKAAKPGEPHWPSPWGEGRPGWHLECSVMSERELGVPFDIHGGGSDLVFPHHENERAQSEAATGKPFVRYWMHGGMLQIDSEKMSKSLGNFLLLKDVLAQYPAAVVRMLMLQTHYRSPLDFSGARLDEAAAALERITNVVRNLQWAKDGAGSGPGAPADARSALNDAVREARERFVEAMDDDFNTAGALAAVFELGRACNAFLAEHQAKLGTEDRGVLEEAASAVRELLSVLGIELGEAEREAEPSADVIGMARDLAGYAGTDADEALRALLAAREAARSERNWEAADAVRDALGSLGYAIEDTPQGPRVVRRGGS